MAIKSDTHDYSQSKYRLTNNKCNRINTSTNPLYHNDKAVIISTSYLAEFEF